MPSWSTDMQRAVDEALSWALAGSIIAFAIILAFC
jgi:hypothetical protein